MSSVFQSLSWRKLPNSFGNKMEKFILILFVTFLSSSQGANILAVFPTPSVSHQAIFRAITNVLITHGHSLTVITTDALIGNRNPNLTQIDFSYTYKTFKKAVNFKKVIEQKLDEIDVLNMWIDNFEAIHCEHFENEHIKKILQMKTDKAGKRFDLIIVEYMRYIPWFAVAEWLNVPLIGISPQDITFELHEMHGNIANPIIHPEIVFPFIENLTFVERFRSFKYYLLYQLHYKPKLNKKIDKIVQKYMSGMKLSADELKDRADLLLINAHPALGYIRPILPTTIQLGFIHIEPPKPIEYPKVKEFLDTSKKSIIYMSLGSNVYSSELSEEILSIFINSFKSLPYNIMLKWETENLPNKPKNVMISSWFPQSDVLADPKIKLFITQGGQQSIEEAIDRGIPMIVIPFMADHKANAKRIEKLKIGVHLDLQSLTEKNFKKAIETVLHGHFKKNIMKLKEIVNDEPMKSVDKAVWWIEYVIRHNGTKHLQYAGKTVKFYEKFMLDFLGIAIVSFLIGLKLLSCIMQRVFRSKRKLIVKNAKSD